MHGSVERGVLLVRDEDGTGRDAEALWSIPTPGGAVSMMPALDFLIW